MSTKDISIPALVFSSEETVSKVVAGMIKNRQMQAFIIEPRINRKTPAGLVYANDLVKRNIDNPHNTKIGRFIQRVKPFRIGDTAMDVLNTFLETGFRSIPIIDGNSFITKLSLLKALASRKELHLATARDVMISPHCISTDDSITTAISVMKETGVSRLPVIDEDGDAAGLLDSIVLLKAKTDKRRMRAGEEAGEKIKSGTTLASSLMIRDFPTAGPGSSLDDVVKKMIDKQIPTAIVTEDRRLAGIVTPMQILHFIASRIKQGKKSYVRVSGLAGESDYKKGTIEEEIDAQLKRLSNIMPMKSLIMDIDAHQRSGRRKRYSVNLRAITPRGMLFASSHEWDIARAVRSALRKLDRETIRKKEKARSRRYRQT
jgi:CBS domain-containing protein/ribosome-associated translation inhibitor RaiA